jgi:hypothetical protein
MKVHTTILGFRASDLDRFARQIQQMGLRAIDFESFAKLVKSLEDIKASTSILGTYKAFCNLVRETEGPNHHPLKYG